MDVTCERCGTEYEFDETLVSDRGTTVKCTNCGHLFKVFPPGADPASSDRAWIVRKKSGGTERLGSLRELQQRITEGKVHEDDELSRSGAAWKRLGDIAELQTFFLAAKAAATVPDSGAGPTSGSGPKKQTLFGVGAAPSVPAPPAPPSAAPPAAPPPKPQAPKPAPPKPAPARPAPPPPRPAPAAPAADATQRERPAAPKISEPPPAAAAAPARAPRLDDTPAPASAPARPRAPQISDAPPAAAPARGPRKQALYFDEGEAPKLPTKRSGRLGLWLLLVLLIGGGAAVAWKWDVVAPMIGLGESAPEDPLQPFLSAGDTALALDTEAGYEDAIREFTRASALAETDERVLVALSRTHGAMAQSLAFHHQDLVARSADDPAAAGAAERVARDRDEHAAEAKEFAELVLEHHPASAEGELVLADALRLSGELADARHHLDRSGSMRDEPTANLHLARGLLAAAETLSSQSEEELPEGESHPPWLASAKTGVMAAVAQDGDLLRARLALARVLLAERDVEGARREIAAVRERVADHPAAVALAEAIDQGRPPAPPVVEVEGTETETETGTETETETASAMTETPPETSMQEESSGSSSSSSGTRRPRDYSDMIREGGRLLSMGDTAGAREMYEAALAQRPGSSEANDGLGRVAVRDGNLDQAATYFRAAARNDYGDAYFGLADVYRRQGRRDDAVATYRAYLRNRPSGRLADRARQQIEALGGGETTMESAPTMDEPPEMTEAPMEETPMEAAPVMEEAPAPAPVEETPVE